MKHLFLILITFFNFGLQAQFFNNQLDKVDIIAYDFHIQINDDNNQIAGQTSLSFTALKPVQKIALNLKNKNAFGKGMAVQKVVWQDSISLKYQHTNDSLRIEFPKKLKPQKTYRLQVFYKGIPADGLYIKQNKYGKRTFFGDNWPTRAQYWLPVIDHPSDKALVSWTITAPAHYDVVASGRLVTKINKDSVADYFFETQVPLPTKVMVFAAADFNIKNYPVIKLHQKCVPVSSWIFKDSPANGFDDYKCSIPILQHYDSLIGPYSYEKMSNVQSKTRFGGMENAGNIFYEENSVDGTKSVENLVAHETAHQWFGNSVTEKNWRDIWLSEGFATYLTDLYLEHKYGKQKLKERMAMERAKVIRYNRYKAKPIVYDEQENLFNLLSPNSYEKGAWVLHMLRQKTGDEKFFKVLTTFYKKFRNSNASTEDFIDLSEKISGQNLQEFFAQWLYKAGVPQLKINWKKESNKIIIEVEQVSDIYKLDLPVKLQSGDKKALKTLSIRQQKQVFEFKIPRAFQPENLQLEIDPEVQVLFELKN